MAYSDQYGYDPLDYGEPVATMDYDPLEYGEPVSEDELADLELSEKARQLSMGDEYKALESRGREIYQALQADPQNPALNKELEAINERQRFISMPKDDPQRSVVGQRAAMAESFGPAVELPGGGYANEQRAALAEQMGIQSLDEFNAREYRQTGPGSTDYLPAPMRGAIQGAANLGDHVTGLGLRGLQAIGNAAEAAGAPMGNTPERLGRYADKLSRDVSARGAWQAKTDEDFALPGMGYVRDAVSAGVEFTPAGVAAGPVGAIGYSMSTAGNDAYTSAKDQGLSEKDALLYASRAAVIEGTVGFVLQKVGLGGFEAAFSKKMLGKSLKSKALFAGFGEGLEEGTVEGGNILNEMYSGLNPGDNKLGRIRDASIVGGLMGGGAGAVRGAYASGEETSDTTLPDALASLPPKVSSLLDKFIPIAQAARDYQGPPPPTSRKGFEEATGMKGTSKEEREVFAEVVAAKEQVATQEAPYAPAPLPENKADLNKQIDQAIADYDKQQSKSQPTPTVDPEQQPLLALVEDHARALGLTLDEYVAKKSKDFGLSPEVKHVSPAVFQEFSLKGRGTGTGTEARGAGGYFATTDDIIEHYGKGIEKDTPLFRGVPIKYPRPSAFAVQMVRSNMEADFSFSEARDNAIRELDSMISFEEEHGTPESKRKVKEFQRSIDVLKDMKESDIGFRKGKTPVKYSVRLNALPDEYLDWDMPLAAQSETVKGIISKAPSLAKLASNSNTTGGELYRALSKQLGGNVQASKALRELGIKGNKFINNVTAQSGNKPSTNYVAFSEQDIEIVSAKQGEDVVVERGRQIMAALESSDPQEAVRSLVQLFVEDTDDAGRAALERFAGVSDGEWTRNGVDKVVAGFTEYMESGKPNKGRLAKAFEKMRDWFRNIYNSLGGKVNVSPEVQAVFDSWFAVPEQSGSSFPSAPEAATGAAPVGLAVNVPRVELNLREKASRLAGKTKDSLRRGMGSALGKKSDQAYDKAKGIQRRFQKEVDLSNKAFVAEAKRIFNPATGGTPIVGDVVPLQIPENVQIAIDDYLKGGPDLPIIPRALIPHLDVMRAKMDAGTKAIQDAGIPDEALEAVMDENLGVYMNRTYRKHQEDDWASRVMNDPKIVEPARKWFSDFMDEHFPDSTTKTEDIEWLIRNFAYRDSAEISAKNAPPGIVKNKDFWSILKKRKQFPREILDLMGEYRDPLVNFTNTLTKMGGLLADHSYLEGLEQIGLDAGLLHDPTPGATREERAAEKSFKPGAMSPDHPVEINAENLPGAKYLHGYYTTPEHLADLQYAFSTSDTGKWMRRVAKAAGYARMAQTVGGFPRSPVRNFLGNPLMVLSNGFNPFSPAFHLGTAFETGKDPISQELYLELAEQGVTNPGVEAGAINDLMERSGFNNPDSVDETWLKHVAKGGLHKLQEIYQAADTAAKVPVYLKFKEVLKAANPNLTDAQVKAEAANLTRNIMPDHERMPDLMKWFARQPVLGAFVSFRAEVMRNMYHRMKLIAEWGKSGNPVLQRHASKMAAGQAVALAIPYVIAKSLMMYFGITDEEDKKYRRFVAQWMRNSPIFYTGRDERGNPTAWDFGFMDPFSVFSKPVIGLMTQTGDFEQNLGNIAWELTDTWIGEDLVAQRVFDAARNSKPNGGKVWYPHHSLVERKAKQAAHILGAWYPGGLRSAEEVFKAIRKETDRSGKTRSLGSAIMGFLLVRPANYDIRTSLGILLGQHREMMQSATFEYKLRVKNPTPLSKEEHDQLLADLEGVRNKALDRARQDALAAIALGVPEKEVKAMLKETLTARVADTLLGGTNPAYVPTKPLRMEVLNGPAGKERYEMITERFNSAPSGTSQ